MRLLEMETISVEVSTASGPIVVPVNPTSLLVEMKSKCEVDGCQRRTSRSSNQCIIHIAELKA